MSNNPCNALIHETSPYLLQHADNPVQWYPWGEQALNLARQSDKPILLSIGYSACHWCHVMAHESFEDPVTADLMNRHYINVKVDREERPDLDKIYQQAHQLLTQRPGGWPLTLFLMPDDHLPFFAGTYFPKQARYNLPSFQDLLIQVSDFFRIRRHELDDQNRSLLQAFASMAASTKANQQSISKTALEYARQQLEHNMDWQSGGFGKAPKFPHPTSIEHLLRYWLNTGKQDHKGLEMASFTLTQMALGGINDQIGGGFCRYSVDDKWMIPHFEKMLYDNGPLLELYAQAWCCTGDELFKETCENTAAWVMREMQSEQGGYFSSLDADSEGEEGKFYVWQKEQVKSILDSEQYPLFVRRFGLDRDANFEEKWYPHVYVHWQELAKSQKMTEQQARTMIRQSCQKLYAERSKRVHPGRDEKILTSWNALMITGMASAARHLNRPDWLQSAQQALDYIRATHWSDGRLLATSRDGRAHLAAYLDDYAFLIQAILELLQNQWRDQDFQFMLKLVRVLMEHFQDQEHGGFFFTADDHQDLFHRPKPMADESTPAGNGVAAFVLNRLGHLLGESTYIDAATNTLTAAWDDIERLPYAHTSLLKAVDEFLFPPQTIILRGTAQQMMPWLARCNQGFTPRCLTLAIPDDAKGLPEILAQRKSIENAVTAFVCTASECLPPITTLHALDDLLADKQARIPLE